MVTLAPDVIAPDMNNEPQWIDTALAAVIEPDELLVNDPELQVAVSPDKPLIAAFTVTVLPVEVRLKELELLVEATAFETVIEPAVCNVALAELIWF
jgi:hypothetical protein